MIKRFLIALMLLSVFFSCDNYRKDKCVCHKITDPINLENINDIYIINEDTIKTEINSGKITKDYISFFVHKKKINNDTIFISVYKNFPDKIRHSRVIYKISIIDTFLDIDTFYFPPEVKFKKYPYLIKDNIGNIIISPDKKKILFTIFTKNEHYKVLSTKVLIYDTETWARLKEADYPSKLYVNAGAWSPDLNRILFINDYNQNIIMFDIKSNNFTEILTNAQNIRFVKWGKRNDKFYYIYNQKYLIGYSLNTHKKELLYHAKREILREWVLSDFFPASNDTIYLFKVGTVLDHLMVKFEFCSLLSCK